MYIHVENLLLNRLDLQRDFMTLFCSEHTGCEIPDKCNCQICSVTDDLYQEAVKLFLKVNPSQFRRNFLHCLHVKKKKT